MSRTYRDYYWTNEDGQEGLVRVAWGPWGKPEDAMAGHDAPIMVSFEDAMWMGVETADEFLRWLRSAVAEAKREHKPRHA